MARNATPVDLRTSNTEEAEQSLNNIWALRSRFQIPGFEAGRRSIMPH